MIERAQEYRTSNLIKLDQWPLVVDNFITNEEIRIVMNFIENNQFLWTNLDPANFWTGRSLDYHVIHDKTVRDIMLTNMNNMINLTKQHSGFQELHSDLLQITRWPEGYELRPHADGENSDNQPHPFPWRLFGSVIYLNDNFEGGEIHYPLRNISMKPKPGMLSVHPGTLDFLHGVRPVTQGIRYTIASFLTTNISHKFKHD